MEKKEKAEREGEERDMDRAACDNKLFQILISSAFESQIRRKAVIFNKFLFGGCVHPFASMQKQ